MNELDRSQEQMTGELLPVDRANLRRQASLAIRASIASGEFEAGRIYPVAYFAKRLRVSATPVREALFDLVGANLVEAVQNRGFRVPILSEHELDELFDLRMLLERPAVVRLASSPQIGNLDHLREVAEQIVRDARRGDLRQFLIADRRFHHELLKLGDNQRLTEMVMGLRDQTRLYGLSDLANQGRLVESALLHLEMITAIEERNAERVDESIVRHLGFTRTDWAAPTLRHPDASPPVSRRRRSKSE